MTEQRYRAVLEVGTGVPVTEVAERYGSAAKACTRGWSVTGRRASAGCRTVATGSNAHPWQPEVKLDAADAAELAEILQFLSQWLARDPARLAASLQQFVGHPAYGLAQLRDDLERFVFLLGGSDGEPLFGP